MAEQIRLVLTVDEAIKKRNRRFRDKSFVKGTSSLRLCARTFVGLSTSCWANQRGNADYPGWILEQFQSRRLTVCAGVWRISTISGSHDGMKAASNSLTGEVRHK